MIKLDIHDYCNDCDGFEPVFTPGDKLYHGCDTEPIRTDGIVRMCMVDSGLDCPNPCRSRYMFMECRNKQHCRTAMEGENYEENED